MEVQKGLGGRGEEKERKEKQEMREEGRSQSNKNLLSLPQPSALSLDKQKPGRQTKASRKEGARHKLLESVGDQKRERENKRKGENKMVGEILAQ